MHGVEGFFGSAIQIAWLLSLRDREGLPDRGAMILIHGVNPFGFSRLRRTNEDNIDLNRNFLLPNEDFRGASPGYAGLDGFLNPRSPPSRLEPFRLKALWHLSRLGMAALKRAIAVGQYDYPQGLFFGGHGPAESTRIVQDHFAGLIGPASDVVHLDLHSGLGRRARYKLLLVEPASSPALAWYREHFDGERVEPIAAPDGTFYAATGTIGSWLVQHLRGRNYRFLAAEFGTCPMVRILGALRSENRAHFYGTPGDRPYESAKAEIAECFCPKSPSWRRKVLAQGLQIIRTCVAAVSRRPGGTGPAA